MSWGLSFYRQERGNEPVREFLKSLPKAARIEAGAALADVEEIGPNLRRPEADYLRDGIYELRFRSERVEYRILYFFDRFEVVLTNAFVKKTKKVPREEIERAILRRVQWQTR
jgi:phage-related protein